MVKPWTKRQNGWRPRGSRTRVWTLNIYGEPEPRGIKTGVSDGKRTEILDSSLKEGDEVLVDLARAGGASANRGNGRGPSIRIR